MILSYWRAWREQGWELIDAATYAQVWQQYGGSVATHPEVVARLSDYAGIGVRYLGWSQNGRLQAAIPTWGRDLALSKRVLKAQGKRALFDLGNAEVILPIAPEASICLRHRGQYLSALHETQILRLKAQPEGLALARAPEDYSKKFRYNQRREQRLLEEAGGCLRSMQSLSAQEQATIYADLFERRWGFSAMGKAHLSDVFGLLREFMSGELIYLNDQPIAVQILYRVQSPSWVSVEYINGGVDPEAQALSPGSVLSYVNTQSQWEQARAQGKTLRYSFGRADRAYKDRWCVNTPIYFL